MTEEKRKLAAIMFTDLVGYSSLTERNESLAIELLEEKRKIIEAHLADHGGRIIKSTGDGFLIEFSSALHAVKYANIVQSTFKDRNSVVNEGHKFFVRIGIHLGDVVYKEDGDVLGDGVNIAARIEPLAEPGGIAISDQVYDLVHNKIPLGFLSVGKPELKNINSPIEVFHVVEPGVPGVQRAADRPKSAEEVVSEAVKSVNPIVLGVSAVLVFIVGWFLISTVFFSGERIYRGEVELDSIAVLPLENLADSSEDQFLSDGMTEEIINNLAQLKGIRVISRTSVFELRERNLNLEQIGKELDVDYVIEGTIQRDGTTIRIIAKMISTSDGTTIWSNKYDREFENAFVIQDEIARSISERIEVELTDGELASGEDSEPEFQIDPEAYELYLRGRFFWNKRTTEGFHQARNFFNQAIEKQPELAEAHAGLADTLNLMANYRILSARDVFPQARVAANQALALNPKSAEALASLAFTYQHDPSNRDLEKAEELYLQAIEANPNYASAHQWYSSLLNELGRDDEALNQALIAVQLDPLSPIINVAVGVQYLMRDDEETARQYYEQALEVDPLFVNARLIVAELDEANEDFETAEQNLLELAEEQPNSVPVHLDIAEFKTETWQWDEAEQYFRKAIELEEGEIREGDARISYAFYLSLTGRPADAVQQIERVGELNSDLPNLNAIKLLYQSQEIYMQYFDDLPTASERIEALEPDENASVLERASSLLYRVSVNLHADRLDKAMEVVTQIEGLLGPSVSSGDAWAIELSRTVLTQKGMIFARQGDQESAQAVLDELIAIRNYVSVPYKIAYIYLFMGNYDEALTWLEVGVAQRDFVMPYLAYDPVLEPLHDDPRFEAMLRETNLWDRFQNYQNNRR